MTKFDPEDGPVVDWVLMTSSFRHKIFRAPVRWSKAEACRYAEAKHALWLLLNGYHVATVYQLYNPYSEPQV